MTTNKRKKGKFVVYEKMLTEKNCIFGRKWCIFRVLTMPDADAIID